MRLYLAPFLDALLDSRRRPAVVLDLDELDSAVLRSLGQDDEALRFERLEGHYLPRFDHVITSSASDARILASDRVRAASTVSNAVRPPEHSARPAAPHDLVFVGNLSYPPNVDAAVWLCREVVPRMDGVRVALVGSRPSQAVRALEGDGVTVAADVPDVAPWYAGARVAVAPLHAGGGTCTKVLEAFAHRRPVVATARGAQGLGLDPPQGPVVIADSPAEFAAACRRLLDDPREAARLAGRGEAMVRESATVDHVAACIERLFQTILATA
jgi:glycosyltransferase involved in cell wall biosynthesis